MCTWGNITDKVMKWRVTGEATLGSMDTIVKVTRSVVITERNDIWKRFLLSMCVWEINVLHSILYHREFIFYIMKFLLFLVISLNGKAGKFYFSLVRNKKFLIRGKRHWSKIAQFSFWNLPSKILDPWSAFSGTVLLVNSLSFCFVMNNYMSVCQQLFWSILHPVLLNI